MRVKLSVQNLERLFGEVLKKDKKWKMASDISGFSSKTVNDWRRGKYTIPSLIFKKLIVISGLKKDSLSPIIFSDFWHTKDAGRRGALKTKRLYGNFGTTEGRRLGGFRSIATHKKKNTKFKKLKKIKIPKESKRLAEFTGLLIGDGHMSNYQVSFYTSLKTDYEYALFVKSIIKKLFNITPVLKKRERDNTAMVVSSSKQMVNFLYNKGVPIGNKIKNKLKIPNWIFKKISYQKAFIKGLFDTDGCIFLDRHKTIKKTYKYLGWMITSYANNLISDIITVLKNLNFSPTYKISQKSVYLRKQKEVIRYFREIGTSNLKHKNRYSFFINELKKGN